MSFDIPEMHIPENSPEAEIIASIMVRDSVTAQEAVRVALRGMAAKVRTRIDTKPAAVPEAETMPKTVPLDDLLPSIKLLSSVEDDTWAQISEASDRLRDERFEIL